MHKRNQFEMLPRKPYMRVIQKPPAGEYPVHAEMYMKLLPDDGLILNHLKDNFENTRAFICALPQEKLLHRYKKDKWSVKEILVHIIDDERIYAYRALRFARNEQQGLIGFDQDAYAFYSEANCRTLQSIFDEFESVRQSTIRLFENLPEDSLLRRGKGTGSFEGATVRALVYHIAGHELHHINFIKQHYL